MNIPGKLVVRTYAPARRWIMLAMALLLGLMALYVAFELGRYSAGYDAMKSAAERDALQTQIDQLHRTEQEMRVQLTAADEARVAEVRERSEVARSIGELQAQVERQQQDVEFYRGLVAQPRPADTPVVGVQQFHITALPGAQQFSLRFSLNRILHPGDIANGTLAITVDGTQNNMPASQDLAALTGGKGELSFSFRYTSSIEQPVTLPADFKPDRVTIEVRPQGKGVTPYRRTFVWSIDPSG